MADVAHEVSGPASPKPGDVAAQQASRPDSPDRGKLRVFISYSRDDLEFADQLDAALNACGFECVIDRHGISGGEEWKRRLGNLISEADTVVFVLSPTSARSPICTWEAEEAERLGKRILPVICRPLKGASPPPQLRERNYIYFYNDPKAAPGAGFGTGLAKLTAALNTDFDWLREHTRYLQRAIEWDRGGRPADRLLAGDDIAEAKQWAARRPKNAPEPTALHLDFIRASEEEAQARLSAQRKQLEEMAAAHDEREAALKKAEEAQRKRATIAMIRNIALVAVSILALLAGWLGLKAAQQREEAAEQRNILEAATTYMVKSQTEQDEEKKRQAFGPVLVLFQRGADRGDTFYIRNLGLLYQAFGPAQDYTKAREWYEKAADKGDADAMWSVGLLYANGRGVVQDHTKAREWFEKAADKGSAGAAFNLGALYENGEGVRQDYTKAREWYEKAADKESASAMASLGRLYSNGEGVAQDYARAREWFAKAAEKGHLFAMLNLGMLYYNGQGVAQDYVKARAWFEKAAHEGDSTAMVLLGALYANGQGVAQDYAKARELFEKAADKGDALAMLKLGHLYEKGQEYAKAREWYEKAAEIGEPRAKARLEQLPISEVAAAGRYAEALQLQEALAAKVEAAEAKRDGKPGEETAKALNEVAWYALFAREYTKALTVADRAHALLPDDLAIETNRAHALMFMEQGKEAKALYVAHKGKPISEQDTQLWESAIAEDFDEFRKAGLMHPMMAEIEKELGVSP